MLPVFSSSSMTVQWNFNGSSVAVSSQLRGSLGSVRTYTACSLNFVVVAFSLDFVVAACSVNFVVAACSGAAAVSMELEPHVCSVRLGVAASSVNFVVTASRWLHVH